MHEAFFFFLVHTLHMMGFPDAAGLMLVTVKYLKRGQRLKSRSKYYMVAVFEENGLHASTAIRMPIKISLNSESFLLVYLTSLLYECNFRIDLAFRDTDG